MPEVDRLPEYGTKLFSEIYYNIGPFKNDYNNIGIPATISDTSVTTLFYLLYARYGNNPIANWDVEQWKYKIFSVIFQYGPTWEKRLDIQSKLRNMTEDDLMTGSKAIYNHAFNPSSAPSTGSLTELEYINDQNTSNNRRGKLDGYALLWSLLETDVTEEFLGKFRPCFKQFVRPEKPILFVTDLDEEEE